MSYAAAKKIARSDIPVIDIARLRDGSPGGALEVGLAMRAAAQTVGFFYVASHGIDPMIFETAHAASRAFFARPLADKNCLRINRHHHGFLRVGDAKMYDDAKVDLKESFVWGLNLPHEHPAVNAANPFLGRNQWPDQPADFRVAVYPFFEAGLALGIDLMRAFAAGLGLPEDSFIKTADKPIARGSTLYYPPQPPQLGAEQFGVAPHTDFGVLTILWQDTNGGLEALNKAGEWVTAHPIADTLVVNVGDLLARWTNDGFASTPHRVINRSGRERYSMVVAWDPNFETLIDPRIVCRPGETPKYEAISCGQYVLNRFNRAFAYRHNA